ncbi:HAD domain-containing protein [Actinosynnema sp. NPDC059797]
MRRRPLLFLDVDGPLIPFGDTEHPTYPPPHHDNPLLTRCDPSHGPRLAALPCDLVWATTWGEDANRFIAPRLNLPPLPVVTWREPDALDRYYRLHHKTRSLVDHAAGRPFAWLDDEITAADRSWIAEHHPAPALPHRVDPGTGLTGADYSTLTSWLHNTT